MFHDVPEPVKRRMDALQALDAADRADGTPRAKRLRQILQPMLDRAQADPRVDALIVPIGNGELLCRRAGAAGSDPRIG